MQNNGLHLWAGPQDERVEVPTNERGGMQLEAAKQQSHPLTHCFSVAARSQGLGLEAPICIETKGN